VSICSFTKEVQILKQCDSLGQLIKIIREVQMDFVVDKLIDFSASKDDELRDISGLGEPSITMSSL
jgi:hypothetical protein